jgi:hypothetical protein
LLPALHHRRPGGFKCPSQAELAQIISSTTAMVKKLATAIVDLPPNTPASAARAEAADHQIPIDGKPPATPPRVPSLEAFGHRPSAPADRSATSRYPEPFT